MVLIALFIISHDIFNCKPKDTKYDKFQLICQRQRVKKMQFLMIFSNNFIFTHSQKCKKEKIKIFLFLLK
ncbi:MAG: hypothetical protein DBY14_02425 [Escherichia coli]|nr:MAG: hypothetical protein DBY14_02425 [Escherichia coli]